MKISVIKIWRDYQTRVTQGAQTFTIHEGPKADCLWYARMFRKALKNHDAEVLLKQNPRYRTKGIGGS